MFFASSGRTCWLVFSESLPKLCNTQNQNQGVTNMSGITATSLEYKGLTKIISKRTHRWSETMRDSIIQYSRRGRRFGLEDMLLRAPGMRDMDTR